jgi:mannose-6-phosphate isomerase-like protein (cupin superfamily)
MSNSLSIPQPTRSGILLSGRGSNFLAIAESIRADRLPQRLRPTKSESRRLAVESKMLGGSKMRAIRQQDLPLKGSSYQFAGVDHGDVGVSFYLVEAAPGRGAPLHRHNYDEVLIVQEGRGRVVVGNETRDTVAGDILVVKAGTPHGFVNVGAGVLKQIDIHVSGVFEQENLEPTEVSIRAGLPTPHA